MVERGRDAVDAGREEQLRHRLDDLVSERERTEAALREAELKVSNFVENTEDLVTVVNTRGELTYANQACRTIFGLEPEDAIGRQAFEFIHPEDRAATEEAFSGWLAQKVASATYENRQVAVDGSVRDVQWKIMLRYDQEGQPESFWSIARNITEHKRAERALQATLEDLERSNQELEQFAYVASHDLQEPLRMVASYTQLLAERYQGKLDAKADKYIDYAVDGARRMQGLINDLLALSRVGTRGKPLEPTDCAEVVAEVLEGIDKAVQESGARINVGALPSVMADRAQLGQVFQNLISNAIKFCGEAAPAIEISAEAEGTDWAISVADSGVGIEPRYFERIFVIFQRLHGRGEYPGSGIGLAIVKKIVERHGGRIRVESSGEGGARFTFTMPPADEDAGRSDHG